jgi:hypothetical protein
MASLSSRECVRFPIPTLTKLMQQADLHWDHRHQHLQSDKGYLTYLQQRLKALQQIIALSPERCPALEAKVQALESLEADLDKRIASESASCKILEQIFDDAQHAQSVLLKHRERTLHRGRQHFQHLLHEIFAQIQYATPYLA